MSKTILKLSKITKVYWKNRQEVDVVSNLNLEIKKGEVFGFLGPNGAGKTTTIKMIAGLIDPTDGQITIMDEPQDNIEIRSKMGFMPENPYFYHYLTGYELLDFFAGVFGIEKEKRKELIESKMALVGLEEAVHVPIRKYSKGMGQRLGVAQALINDPELILLDEPLEGLDPIGRLGLKKIILDLKKEGKTVFFNSHILSDVEEICDKIGIIDYGRLIKVGAVGEIVPSTETLEKYFVKIINQEREAKK